MKTTLLKRKWKPGLLLLAGATAIAAWTMPPVQASAHDYHHGYYHHRGYYHHYHHGYWHRRPDGVRVWIEL